MIYFFLFLLGGLRKGFRCAAERQRCCQHQRAHASRRRGPGTCRSRFPGRNLNDAARAWRTGIRRERERRPPRGFPPSSDKSNPLGGP